MLRTSGAKGLRTLALVLILITLIVVPLTFAFSITFSGRAFAVSVRSPLTSLTFADTGQLLPNLGVMDATPISVQTQFASSEVLLSVTMGSGSQAESEVAVADLVLLPGTLNQITADFVASESLATCTGGSGSSEIANLQVAGQQVTVSGQPNQTLTVPGVFTLVINEQILTSNGITVSGLHLTTVDGTEVIVSSAYSGESCS